MCGLRLVGFAAPSQAAQSRVGAAGAQTGPGEREGEKAKAWTAASQHKGARSFWKP